ncbi:MAG: hypothetical protein H7Z39_03415 [Burkholderiaceae bacterium]|nr:hypothetical protein [Burkholderiaceae bacterium]
MRKTKTATAKPGKAAITGRKKPETKSGNVEADKVGSLKMTTSGKGKARVYRSDAFEAIHSAATALHSVGAIDKKTMREFDASCFTD